MNARIRALGLLLVLVLPLASAVAEVRLPAVFSDQMVLQHGKPVAVWGWADAGEAVTVSIGDQSKTVKATDAGRWQMELAALQPGGPHALTVSGENRIVIQGVLVGEVWLCSGQSNMAMTVNRAQDFEQEQAAADLPMIRMFTTARQASPEPADDCQGSWAVCSPETVGGFSATAYFFGRQLHRELKMPVGLINSSWGGTAVEAWTSETAQSRIDQLAPIRDAWEQKIAQTNPAAAQAAYETQEAKWQAAAQAARQSGAKLPRRPTPPIDPRLDQNRPANLFNGMIHPLIPYAIRGAIWYQGERNANSPYPELYGLQLAALISDWRSRWSAEFPFLWVQLPNFRKLQTEPVETSGWVVVQEQMLKTLAVPDTGMAVAIDVGEANDIHPRNKQAVGDRLARWALAKFYGRDLCASGPLFKSAELRDGSIVLNFDYACEGLRAEGDALRGFAVAGADQQFVWADAKIDGRTVVVSNARVGKPVAVRYSWASNPVGNLTNGAGLPASPFRTDDWPLDTQGQR
jgi:sialate O-acetylesterase